LFLEKIELKGFKSFAERIQIDFVSGITCIVGPNGSGKSNITDAVRWVLGEQKASVLRGKQMQDIIFSGTAHRKFLNFAEVTLYFDNEYGYFDMPFSQISVKRRLHRSGESEYFINDTPCRLKDVKELFMDTGIGTDGYSIIGQGDIDNILSDNKFDRRLIFEEAAGIVKSNTQKNESQRRLDKVQDNLDRLYDIFSEVKERIGPLKEESEKAREFLMIEKKVKDSQIKYLIDEYDKLKATIEAKEKQIQASGEQLKTDLARREDLKRNMTELGESLRQLRQRLQSNNQRYQEIVNQGDTLNIEISVKEEQMTHLEGTIREKSDTLDSLREEYSERSGDLEEKQRLLEELKSGLEEDELALINLLESLEELEASRKLYSLDLEQLKEAYHRLDSSVNHDAASLMTRKASLQKNLEANLARQERLKILEETSDREQREIDEAAREITALEGVLGEQRENLRKDEAEREKVEDALEALKAQEEEALRRFYRKNSEIELYENMAKNKEGIDSGMKRILAYLKERRLENKILGIVADLLEIPEGFEEAFAVALGRSVSQIVTESEVEAKEIIGHLKRDNIGRASFLPMQFLKATPFTGKVTGEGFLGFGHELPRYEKKYQKLFAYLLGKTLVVDTLEHGIALSKSLSGYHRIVSLEGDLIIKGGPITGGAKTTQKHHVFQVKSALETMKKELTVLEEQVKGHREGLKEKTGILEACNRRIKASTQEMLRDREALLKLKIEVENSGKLHEKTLSEYRQLQETFQTLGDEIDTERDDLNHLEMTLKADREQLAKIEGALHDPGEDSNQGESLLALEGKITEKKVEIATKNEQLRNTTENCRLLEAASKEQQRKIAQIEESLEILREELVDLKDLTDQKRENYDGIRQTLQVFNEEQKKISDEIESLEATRLENEATVDRLTLEIEGHRETIHELEVENAKLDVKRTSLSGNLWEQHELSVIEGRQRIASVDEFITKTELKHLRKRMKEIEHVNLASIEEYEQVQERFTFLSEQIEDLELSRKELKGFIQKIERQMVRDFNETFERINQGYQYVFSELFGGGSGEIRLSEPEDVLNSDIEILCSPPGKKLQRINLLSGGEKALTAIALLFAVLKAKPTPFCVLDEIEAALDDVNVYKFGNFLKDFSKQSQFILITHRKGTMEYADTLYGVSMEEYGISKLISLKLTDYEFQEALDD